tara:strand:- start:7147 stop:7953 length:807 start_codon:yes stop_codon:yes gene_type:complete
LIFLLFLFFLNCEELKIISYNIRYEGPNETLNSWESRKSYVSEFLINENPDFAGLQEVTNSQLKYLSKSLTNHSYIGVGRDDGLEKGEYSPIFFNKKKFKILIEDTFWLSETPNKISVGWDASMKRICTYGLFENLFSKKRIWVLNTHFDHIGIKARKRSTDLILKVINELNSKNEHLILMGDFNLEDDTSSIKKIQNQLDDVLFGIKKSKKNYSTYNGFSKDEIFKKRIDYIFTQNLKNIKSQHVYIKTNSYFWVSDHNPVVARVKM